MDLFFHNCLHFHLNDLNSWNVLKQDWKKLTFPDARLLAWQHTGWLQPHRYLQTLHILGVLIRYIHSISFLHWFCQFSVDFRLRIEHMIVRVLPSNVQVYHTTLGNVSKLISLSLKTASWSRWSTRKCPMPGRWDAGRTKLWSSSCGTGSESRSRVKSRKNSHPNWPNGLDSDLLTALRGWPVSASPRSVSKTCLPWSLSNQWKNTGGKNILKNRSGPKIKL